MNTSHTHLSTDKVRGAAYRGSNVRVGSFPKGNRLRDRHGRGLRGSLLFPSLPGWKTRREQFYLHVKNTVVGLSKCCPEVGAIEFGVEEIPPSDPAGWEEHNVVYARVFPADKRRGLANRVVLYRLPIVLNCSEWEIPQRIRSLLVAKLGEILGDKDDNAS